MSEVIEFAKILTRLCYESPYSNPKLGRLIEKAMDEFQATRGRDSADASGADTRAEEREIPVAPEAGSRPAPSPVPPEFQRRQCNTCGRHFWNMTGICPCIVNNFDREAAARRAFTAVFDGGEYPCDEIWRSTACIEARAKCLRVVDAVLDVPAGFATDNARPDHADNAVTVDAPSPSLDALEKKWRRIHSDMFFAGDPVRHDIQKLIDALKTALAAAQAEVKRGQECWFNTNLERLAAISERDQAQAELADHAKGVQP